MDVLVVASKVKKYIKEKADMKCSGTVMEALTKKICEDIDVAVENAKKAKRKTVMDKDFE